MLRPEKFRRIKFSIVLICATIFVIYSLETRERQCQSTPEVLNATNEIQTEESSNSYATIVERQRQFATAKVLNAVNQLEKLLNTSYKLLDDGQRQSQLATAKILNAISRMEESLMSSATTLLEPTEVRRCQSSGRGLFLLVMVMSSPGNLDRRRAIRSSWAEMRSQWEAEFKRENQNRSEVTDVFRLLFFLGQSKGDVWNDTQAEWNEYGDLVIDNFHDESYLTLTLKTLRMLRWVTLNCADAKYVMKLDDDAFVHIPKLLKSISNFTKSQNQSSQKPRVMLGNVVRGSSVSRDHSSEFFVPEILYSWEQYPTYLSDFCYVLGMGAAQEIIAFVEESKSTLKLFHIEDVFVLGIVANERLGIPLEAIGPILIDANTVVGTNKTLNLKPSENETTTSLPWVLQHVVVHPVTFEQNRCWTKFTGQGQRNLTEDC